MIEAGVDLTRRVEKMLGQNASRTLSLRDVPGITRGAVPLLAELGVPYISVGANNNPCEYDHMCICSLIGYTRRALTKRSCIRQSERSASFQMERPAVGQGSPVPLA